jgi:hypothetical protein
MVVREPLERWNSMPQPQLEELQGGGEMGVRRDELSELLPA